MSCVHYELYNSIDYSGCCATKHHCPCCLYILVSSNQKNLLFGLAIPKLRHDYTGGDVPLTPGKKRSELYL